MEKTITGYTGLYGLVADPIKHSFSPMMHNTAFQTLGIDDVYLAFEVPSQQLSDFLIGMKTLNVKGFNVSMPYKNTIMSYLDEISETAQICQAVNTVKNVDGRLIGDITDGEGFVLACQEKHWDIQDQKIVVLGAGGAASAIIVALARHGAKEIVVYNRSIRQSIFELDRQLPCPIRLKALDDEDSLRYDLLDSYLCVQATNVGMTPHTDACLIHDPTLLGQHLKVADLIYQPRETKLLKMAKERGLDYMNGERMILYQGAVAFEYWTGEKMPIEAVKKALGME